MILVPVSTDAGTALDIIILFFYWTSDWNRKSPKLLHIQPPNSTHIWTLIRHIAVHVSVLIRITVLDLEPNPCFQIFLNISKINDRIFNCNISKRRSGQELPFHLLWAKSSDMSMRTLWPKNRKCYIFLHISPPHPLPFKNILRPCKELP